MEHNTIDLPRIKKILHVFGLPSAENIAPVLGGGRSDVFKVESGGKAYALRILHATVKKSGIQYVDQVTRSLHRLVEEVPAMLLAQSGRPYVTTEGRVATLTPWFCGTAPASDAPWLLDASAKLLARLHKSALCIPVCYPRPDRPTYHGLNWAKNYLFELDVVRSLLYTDPSPLYKTCRAEDLKVIDEILKHRAFIMEQHCVWSKQVRKLHRTRPNLIRAPIHGDIYAANMLCNGERIVAVIDWDECQYEPLVYELGRVLWELAKDGQTHSLDEIKMASFLSEYRRNGGPVPDEELDLLVFYIGMLRIIEILLYLNNSTKGDYWSARYTLDNLRALEQLEMPF